MKASRKRTKRSVRIAPDETRYSEGVLTLIEYRDGVERVVRVDLGRGKAYLAERIHERCVEHAKAVREARRVEWNSANNACKRMGVTE